MSTMTDLQAGRICRGVPSGTAAFPTFAGCSSSTADINRVDSSILVVRYSVDGLALLQTALSNTMSQEEFKSTSHDDQAIAKLSAATPQQGS